MADNTLSCQRETLHSQQLRSIKKSIDSDHGIYRDLRNVAANYPFERSRTFPGIQPNVGAKDYSRVRCGVAETQLRPSARISARDACAEPMIGVLLGIGRRLPIFVLTTAKDNVASPARTQGNSARSPSRRSV